MIAYFDNFYIEMTEEQANSVSHIGECEPDVIELIKNPKIREQLDKISDEDLINELRETGIDSEFNFTNREENEIYIIWIAGGNIIENIKEDRENET